uniref:Ovule protein n=1 Tax=Echinostoma caproni TaxID=27848 RepID=A0A183BFQ0_9TREM
LNCWSTLTHRSHRLCVNWPVRSEITFVVLFCSIDSVWGPTLRCPHRIRCQAVPANHICWLITNTIPRLLNGKQLLR